MLGEYLSGDHEQIPNDNYLVTIHVDQSALAGNEGRSALPIESVKRICCNGHAVVLTEDDNGEPLSIGRKSRIIPKAIERALYARDHGCCRFPGCSNHRFLHSHHIDHWSNGGETSLENLMLLCTKHHTLVHEGGYRIERDFQHRWTFMHPDGRAIPKGGYSSLDMMDDDGYRIPPAGGLEHDNPPAGGLLSVAENSTREPPAPVYWH